MNSIIVLTIDLLCPILLFHSDCLTLDDFMCWERELLLNGLSHNSWVSLRHYTVNLTGGEPQMCWCLLYRSVKIIRNSMYLPPNTRLTHKMNNRLTLITVFCFRVDPPPPPRHMKPKNTHKFVNLLCLFICVCYVLRWICRASRHRCILKVTPQTSLLCLIRLTALAMELSSDLARIPNQGGRGEGWKNPRRGLC
jgi:hypothetical protein